MRPPAPVSSSSSLVSLAGSNALSPSSLQMVNLAPGSVLVLSAVLTFRSLTSCV